MAIVLGNRAKMSTSTTGTGTITLGSALSGYQTFAQAGITNGQTVRYTIEDGTDFEIGSGVFTSSGTTLTRNVTESTNSDNAINLSGSGEVFITASAADIFVNDGATSLTTTGVGTFASLDISGDIDVDGTTNLDAVDIDGAVNIAADLTIASTNKILFNDASQFIQGSSATVLSIAATDEIDLTATTIDINGAVALNGAVTGATNVTLSGELDAATGDFATSIAVANVDIATGAISLRNGGTQSYIRFYCESSNAHYAQLQAPAHSAFSGNVTLTLPATTDTIAGIAATQTFTNKTLTSPVLNTGSVGTSLAFPDNAKALFGAGSDLQIYHDGGTSFIEDAGTGNLQIKTNGAEIDLFAGSDYMMRAFKDGAVSLYYDNAAKLSTTATGVDVTGNVIATGVGTFASLDISGDIDVDGTTNLDAVDIDGAVQLDATLTVGANDQGYDVIFHGDSASRNMQWDSSIDCLKFTDAVKILLGDSNDLQIYHDGSDSYVDDNGTGGLILRGNAAVTIGKYTGETMGFFEADGAVTLYYNNAAKIATTATGVSVTGELAAATLDISGNVDIDGTLETDALSINGTTVTSTAAELNILDGVTSNATELNVLDALDRGSLIYGNSSGATAVLGQGSANQVLTSDGTDISWADAAGGPAYTRAASAPGSPSAGDWWYNTGYNVLYVYDGTDGWITNSDRGLGGGKFIAPGTFSLIATNDGNVFTARFETEAQITADINTSTPTHSYQPVDADGTSAISSNSSGMQAVSNTTRGVINMSKATNNGYVYVTLATHGAATAFGNAINALLSGSGCDHATRGVFAVGKTDNNSMEYITIASTGNATDFGDLTVARYVQGGQNAIANTTRGVFSGGNQDGPGRLDVMDYITILTAGNATDFGNLTATVYDPSTACSIVRGLIFSGTGKSQAIDYITIASAGNASDFGDHLSANNPGYGYAIHNKIYAYYGRVSGVNYQEKHTIATAANATAFTWTQLGNIGTASQHCVMKGWIAASG